MPFFRSLVVMVGKSVSLFLGDGWSVTVPGFADALFDAPFYGSSGTTGAFG